PDPDPVSDSHPQTTCPQPHRPGIDRCRQPRQHHTGAPVSLRTTLTRTVATAAASAALVVGAAGVASAASMSHDVDGNTVSATFSIGIGDISMPVDGCVAVVAERSQQQGVFNRIKDMVDLDTIGDTFRGETTTVLRAENNSPVA